MISRQPMKRPLAMAILRNKTGLSARTIRRYFAEPRSAYLEESTERAAPWRDQGISRRTWYRRKAFFKGLGVAGHA